MRPADERTFAELLQDIVGSIREIIRLEIRLARAELTESVTTLRRAAMMMAAGGVALLFAVELLLLSAVFALALVMPAWAAALVVAGAIAAFGTGFVIVASRRLERVRAPKHTIASVQENLSWPTTPTR